VNRWSIALRRPRAPARAVIVWSTAESGRSLSSQGWPGREGGAVPRGAVARDASGTAASGRAACRMRGAPGSRRSTSGGAVGRGPRVTRWRGGAVAGMTPVPTAEHHPCGLRRRRFDYGIGAPRCPDNHDWFRCWSVGAEMTLSVGLDRMAGVIDRISCAGS
jgi:hypothetical protein